jgi:hypothetical protein
MDLFKYKNSKHAKFHELENCTQGLCRSSVSAKLHSAWILLVKVIKEQ